MDKHLYEKLNAMQWTTDTTRRPFVVELGSNLLEEIFWHSCNDRLQIVVMASNLVQVNLHQLLARDRVVSQLGLELCHRCSQWVDSHGEVGAGGVDC